MLGLAPVCTRLNPGACGKWRVEGILWASPAAALNSRKNVGKFSRYPRRYPDVSLQSPAKYLVLLELREYSVLPRKQARR